MIHLLDRNEQIIDVLVNPSQDKGYWDTNMTEDVDNSLLSFVFTTLSTNSFDNVFKIVAQDQDGDHRLFIVSKFDPDINTQGLTQIVQADGDHNLLGLEAPIAPTRLTGATLATAGQFILQNTPYQLGVVDFMGINNVEFTQYTTPLAALQQIKDQFGCVLKFRVQLEGNIFVRYVDLLQPSEEFSGKELVFGKDILDIQRSVDWSSIVTRMIGEAYDSDGNLVSFASVNDGKNYVESAESFARWNINGRHRYGIHQYQPEDGGDIDPAKMLAATQEAFDLTNDQSVSYQVTPATLEQIPGYEHEKIRVYMNVRIKDEGYAPALYLTAQVKQTEMPELDDKSGNFVYQFGDYKLIDIKQTQQLSNIQSQFNKRSPVWDGSGAKATAAQQAADNASQQVVTLGKAVDGKSTIVASPTEPTDTTSFWIDTSASLNVLKHFDASKGTWVKASATDFIDLGGQVVTDQIAPKAVTVDKMSVAMLSAITEKVGELTGGILNGMEINGATIQSIIDAKNFLQIVGPHLHIEGNNGGDYNVFDVDVGIFSLEFGFEDEDGRVPSGQMRLTGDGVVFAEIESTGAGLVIDPRVGGIYFGTAALKNNRVLLQSAGALAGGNGLDLLANVTGEGAFRVFNDVKQAYADGYFNNLFATALEGNPFNPSNNVYTRPKSGGIHLVTQAGTTNVLMEIRAARFTTSSHKKFKANIEAWTDSVWDMVKNTPLYSYNLKDDLDQNINFKHYGVILGDGYGAPDMMVLPDGEHIDEHNSSMLALKAAQEAINEIDNLKAELLNLKNRVTQLEEQK